MRHVFTIHGVKEDGSKYTVVAYDCIKQCKRHFDKLNSLLDTPEMLQEYDRTGNKAVRYLVTKVIMHASFGGFEWFHMLGQWFHLRDSNKEKAE